MPIWFIGCSLPLIPLFCLVPAVASSVIYGIFLVEVILAPSDPYFSLTLSIPLSLAPIIHWCFYPRDPVVHISGCSFALGICMLVTILLARSDSNNFAIPFLALIGLGAFCGTILGFVVFHSLVVPVCRLVRSLAIRPRATLYLAISSVCR